MTTSEEALKELERIWSEMKRSRDLEEFKLYVPDLVKLKGLLPDTPRVRRVLSAMIVRRDNLREEEADKAEEERQRDRGIWI